MQEEFQFGPSLVPLVVVTLVAGPGVALAAATFIYHDGELAGSIIAVASTWLWLSIATLKIRIADGEISSHRFWMTRWRANVSAVGYAQGAGGDFGILPVIYVVDRQTKKRVGMIPLTQFRPHDLEKVRALLPKADAS